MILSFFFFKIQDSINMKVKVAQLCLTPCDPVDYTVHEILQAWILEWVAFPFSRGLPNPGIEPGSPAWQVDSLPTELSGTPCIKKQIVKCIHYCQSSLTLNKIARKTFLDKHLAVNFFTFFFKSRKMYSKYKYWVWRGHSPKVSLSLFFFLTGKNLQEGTDWEVNCIFLK